MTDDAKMRSQLFTGHLERLDGATMALEFIPVQHWGKVTANEGVKIIHEQVDSFGHSGVTDFLPDDVQITPKDITNLGMTSRAC